MGTTQLTQAHAKSLDNVLAMIDAGGGKHTTHPDHQAFLKHTAEHGGLAESRYPALHAAIAKATVAAAPDTATKAAPHNFKSAENVVFVAANRETNKLMARVVLTRTRPVAMMKVTAFVAMKQQGSTVVLAHGQVVQFVGQTVQVDTDTETALTVKAGTKVTVLTSWVVNYQDGTTEINSHAVSKVVKASTDPIIKAPVQNKDRTTGDLTNIVIGLARGYSVVGRNADVDYWFWQHEPNDFDMLVPLQGSFKLKQKPASIGINNPALEFDLTLAEGGSSGINQQDAQQYAKYFMLDPTDKTGRTVLFDMHATADDQGSAINFGKCPWVSETRCFFTAKITCAYDDILSGAEEVVITSSVLPDQNPLDGIAHIKPLTYVWHCLAKGTKILLADGATKLVEDITNEDTVMSDGGPRPVLATLAQPHHGRVLVLAFNNGSTLTVSATHPMCTPSGAVQASSLKVGDRVRAHGGEHTTLTSVKEERLAGHVLYNLWLDPTRPGETTFVANGIQVGDYLIQGRLLREAAADPAKVRARLHPSMHTDYASWLEDRSQRKAHARG
ncbi:Hint domain-containing protein [Pendulispora brunnea]|uniref:Hint domain-containing protein n=1 Tax=Pendulispora brunnea TaxID=2905690 RepID=A0ABZ2K7E6_9BACT